MRYKRLKSLHRRTHQKRTHQPEPHQGSGRDGRIHEPHRLGARRSGKSRTIQHRQGLKNYFSLQAALSFSYFKNQINFPKTSSLEV